jgi:hypothetical protein
MAISNGFAHVASTTPEMGVGRAVLASQMEEEWAKGVNGRVEDERVE